MKYVLYENIIRKWIKNKNKFFKISDLKILFVKDCKSKKCKMCCFFCGYLYEYILRWYFNLVDVLFILFKLKMGNFWGVSLLLKLVSVKYFLLVVVLRLVKKEEVIMEIKLIVFDFL